MVTYDVVKHKIIKSGALKDGVPCHFLSAVTAGFIAVVISSPVDVTKTRYMNATPGKYSSVFHCTHEIYSASGWKGFYKGLVYKSIASSFIGIDSNTSFPQFRI